MVPPLELRNKATFMSPLAMSERAGDVTPSTWPAKGVAGMLCFISVLFMAMPISAPSQNSSAEEKRICRDCNLLSGTTMIHRVAWELFASRLLATPCHRPGQIATESCWSHGLDNA